MDPRGRSQAYGVAEDQATLWGCGYKAASYAALHSLSIDTAEHFRAAWHHWSGSVTGVFTV
jgi:hypothetical protein